MAVTSVWVQILIIGEENPERDPVKIEPLPADINDLKKRLRPSIDDAELGNIFVYPPGTTVASSGTADRDRYIPSENLAELIEKLDDTSPLIVVMPKATDFTIAEPPPKRQKIRDSRTDTKVQSNQCIDLTVNKLKNMKPTASETVCYYARDGMAELFDEMLDPRKEKKEFNIEFIGAPGTGKSNLVWAAAEHLGKVNGTDVIWAGRRSRSDPWNVFQFKDGVIYGYSNLPSSLSEILKVTELKESNVLIMDAPVDISDPSQRDDGAAAYRWASDTAYHDTRRGIRRVIHVSSLGASTKKETERGVINVEEKVMRPWTRRDFVKALEDSKLKELLCRSLDLADTSSVTPEDLVDTKFYYSGINARWFFNYSIEQIKNECDAIIERLNDRSVRTGDRHREAVNSAFQNYSADGRHVVLFTSAYLANAMGRNTNARKLFFQHYPLIEQHLGSGAPGEIFEADLAVHLHHCHDLAAAQRAVMGDKAQRLDVPLGTTQNGRRVLWPTGKLYSLPASKPDGVSSQSLPKDAIREKDNAPNVAQWFLPTSNSQPFLDFFVLVPTRDSKWQLRCIQSTIGNTHSANTGKLQRVINGVLDCGYILCNTIVVAYVVESLKKSGEVGLTETTTIQLSMLIGTRSNSGNQSLEFMVDPLHVAFTRTGSVPG